MSKGSVKLKKVTFVFLSLSLFLIPLFNYDKWDILVYFSICIPTVFFISKSKGLNQISETIFIIFIIMIFLGVLPDRDSSSEYEMWKVYSSIILIIFALVNYYFFRKYQILQKN